MSSILGVGYLYLIVILFIALLSTHICWLPSLLGTNRAGTAQGFKDSHTSPFDVSSYTCLWIPMVSLGFILYVGLFGRTEPWIRSIGHWISLLGGKPIGISSGNKWQNWCVNKIAIGWLGRGVSYSSWLFKIHSLKALNSWYKDLKVVH